MGYQASIKKKNSLPLKNIELHAQEQMLKCEMDRYFSPHMLNHCHNNLNYAKIQLFSTSLLYLGSELVHPRQIGNRVIVRFFRGKEDVGEVGLTLHDLDDQGTEDVGAGVGGQTRDVEQGKHEYKFHMDHHAKVELLSPSSVFCPRRLNDVYRKNLH